MQKTGKTDRRLSNPLGDERKNRSTKGWGLAVAVLLHVLVGLSIMLAPPPVAEFVEVPVTLVELIEPPSKLPDAGEAKEAGGGGGGQTQAAESEAEPEPAAAETQAETPAPTPEVQVAEPQVTPAPTPVIEVAQEVAPAAPVPTPIRPRLAVLPAPSELALVVDVPRPEPSPAVGFLSAAATASASRMGQGSGSGAGSTGGSGSGTGTGQGSGSGSGTGSGNGSGEGTGSSARNGPGASCDMLERLTTALRNAPQVRAAVADLTREAKASGQALIIWDGEWITAGGQDGRGLAGVRQAVSVTVAFAPKECTAEPVKGMVVIDLGEGDHAPRVALGKAHWQWKDLLEVERAR